MGDQLKRCVHIIGLMSIAVALSQSAAAATPKPAAAVSAPKATAPAKTKLGPPPDKQTSAKVNAYIELMNAETNHVFSMRDDLLKKVDPKVGPTCKEYLHLEQEIGPNGGKYDAYRDSLKLKPALPPDAAALQMVDAAEDLWKLGGEPGPHGPPPRGPSDAWCKRLKEVFPRYMAAFDKYAQGNREVSAYVESFTEDRDLREVDSTLKKYGRHYRYEFAALTVEGKSMMRAVRAELGRNAPDSAVVRKHFNDYFAIGDETLAMMNKEPSTAQDPYPTSFNFFLIESMPKLKRASDDLLGLLAAKPDKQAASGLDQRWSSVVDAYNEIIRYGNQIEWSAKQK